MELLGVGNSHADSCGWIPRETFLPKQRLRGYAHPENFPGTPFFNGTSNEAHMEQMHPYRFQLELEVSADWSPSTVEKLKLALDAMMKKKTAAFARTNNLTAAAHVRLDKTGV